MSNTRLRAETGRGNVRTKRIYDEPSPEDGRRILITRYWPRGVPRGAADEYNTKLAPSKELVQAFKHENLRWDDYVDRFHAEMEANAAREEIARMAELAQDDPVTLMCMCEDERRCHRSLVARLVRETIATNEGGIMNQSANTGIVQQAYAAFGSGDIPALMALLDPSIEWDHPGADDIPWGGAFRGHEGAGKFFQVLGENADFNSFEPHTFVSDGDKVLVQGRQNITIKSTGNSYETDWVHAFTLSGGKVTSFKEYTDTAAIAAACRG